jgi:hypothetical protein
MAPYACRGAVRSFNRSGTREKVATSITLANWPYRAKLFQSPMREVALGNRTPLEALEGYYFIVHVHVYPQRMDVSTDLVRTLYLRRGTSR